MLARNSLATPETGLSVQQIALALLEFTTSAPGITPLQADVLRAIAVVLEHAQTPDPLVLLGEEIQCLADVTQHHESQAVVLTNTAQELKETLHNSVEHFKKCVEKACNTLQEMSNNHGTTPGNTRMSYVGAVKSNSPTQHRDILAKSKAITRQVLINSGPNQNLHTLTEKELVAKANIALGLLKDNSEDLPEDMTFFSTRKLRNSTTIFEVDRPESAEWLKETDNRQSFLAQFDANAYFIDKSFKTIVEFIPVTLAAANPRAAREIEEKANLTRDSIKEICWIKPEKFRSASHRVAHTIISFTTPEDTNVAIREGLTIEGRKVNTSKQLPDVMQCYNCQSLKQDHVAKNCPSTHESCGTCIKEHKTLECTATDPKELFVQARSL
ncbi:hypothetical protein PAXRUDRAFT_14667 [Paxillus rubicundulus Ve08.2h10]|uniref:Uncharacterized protein n=1 Tax=Paxillus rubicundulus Ve08.2h10 TaxID=930991 RepID=A0A0D0DLI2_9AGAM|nr:hypothetical protein PAXRUDRAFT_14667 [Paxillus rubicundulus Ve08.2h10]